jgi:hypothetical protein
VKTGQKEQTGRCLLQRYGIMIIANCLDNICVLIISGGDGVFEELTGIQGQKGSLSFDPPAEVIAR